MSDAAHPDDDTRRQLGAAIAEFLWTELSSRPDLTLEDRESLALALECMQSVYGGPETSGPRPLLDLFMQASNPTSVRDRQQAEQLRVSGNEKLTGQRYAEAEQDYSAAIDLDPHNAVLYFNRAGALIRLERHYEALADCRQAVLLSPDYSRAFGRMGQAYAGLESHRRAARCFRRALQLDPGDEEGEAYRRNLAVAERRLEEQQQDPANIMGTLIQGILGSILGGATAGPMGSTPGGATQGPMPAFVIMSEPHSSEECESGHSEESGSSEQQQATGSSSEGGGGSSEEETIHIRVLFGIPFEQPDEGTGDAGSNPMESSAEGLDHDCNHPIGNQGSTTDDDAIYHDCNLPEDSETDNFLEDKMDIQEDQEGSDGTEATEQKTKEDGPKDSSKNPEEQKDTIKLDENTGLLVPPSNSTTQETSDIFNHQPSSNNPATQEASDSSKSVSAEQNENKSQNVADASNQPDSKENKYSPFRVSDISNFFKNLGRSSSSHSDQNKSGKNGGGKEKVSENKDTEGGKEEKPSDTSKKEQEK